MKLLIALVLASLFAAPAPLVHAATATDWTQGPTLLWRYQCDPTFQKDSETLASAPVTAFFGYTLANVSTGESQFFQVQPPTSFDMVALGKETVTASGTTVTYAQLAALNGQAAMDQYNAQQAQQKALALAKKSGP